MFAAGYATGDHPLRFLKSCGVNAIDGKNWPWLNSGDCITHETLNKSQPKNFRKPILWLGSWFRGFSPVQGDMGNRRWVRIQQLFAAVLVLM